MSAPATGARAWLRIVAWGVVYFLIGFLTATITRHTASAEAVRIWRLASWGVSLGMFAACVSDERRRTPDAPARTALRAALAVAVGGLLLAVVATVHALSAHSARGVAPQLVALVAWPVMLGAVSFVAALVALVVMGAMRKG